MKPNMGLADRIIRFFLVLIIAVLFYMDMISGTVAIVLGIVAVAFVLTSFCGRCPLYTPLGISTHKEADRDAEKS